MTMPSIEVQVRLPDAPNATAILRAGHSEAATTCGFAGEYVRVKRVPSQYGQKLLEVRLLGDGSRHVGTFLEGEVGLYRDSKGAYGYVEKAVRTAPIATTPDRKSRDAMMDEACLSSAL